MHMHMRTNDHELVEVTNRKRPHPAEEKATSS
eukprot:CAMPEP_0119485664 /NCGR_PEP_ID=MMETSP1344-20130328/12303_1 /TAXON_ID=236787 /ORGANISM="Florenciella parvula, Strain CCMP2471" /LENGTH=31 /DNA_ID= /DNA_START= /DNA_END= /DNA_ORIENTATION=